MGGPRGEKDSVSIWFVREALAGLARRGGDPGPVLEAAGIPSNLLIHDQSRVSATSFARLWLAIAAAIDDELFGTDARRLKAGTFALLCRATVRAPDLREASSLAVQCLNAIMDDAQLALEESGGEARLVVAENRRSDRPLQFRVFAHETVMIMLHGLMCWLIGRRIPLRRAAFGYPRPEWWREYGSMYAQQLEFDAPDTRIAFSARSLDAAVVQDAQSAREFLRSAPHNFIVKYRDSRSTSSRIRQRMRASRPDGWPGVPEMAQEMGIGVSTLHRRLEQEGTSFREIRDALRRDLAIDRLTHSETSVADIAAELGFAEPSAFHRAFKAWTGVRPGDYRRATPA